jgi:diguanylate cyclase (GGDEF)-like protein
MKAQDLIFLKKSNLLDTPIQDSFERITRLTKRIFNVPIVAFTLVDADRQWFKSTQGLNICETARDVSFCAHALNQEGMMIVNNALLDERFIDNPLVLTDPFIRFYAGYPVYSEDRVKIGTICIIDTIPKNLSEADLEPLKDMAALLEVELKANKAYFERFGLLEEISKIKKTSLVDGLTRVMNRAAMEDMLKLKISSAVKEQQDFGVAIVDIDNFKSINDTYGHCAGDEVLRQISKRLLSGYRDTDLVGRWGGEEFLVIIDSHKSVDLFNVAERARHLIASSPIMYNEQPLNLTVTTGVSQFNAKSPIDMIKLISEADAELYRGKHDGKNVVVVKA